MQIFLTYLRAADEAHIVNVSSMLVFATMPGHTSYCASKFAIRGFNDSLYSELFRSNVGLSCVYPGFTDTEIISIARTSSSSKSKEIASKVLKKMSISPEKVASKVVVAIERKKPRLRIGLDTYLFDILSRLKVSKAPIEAIHLQQSLTILQAIMI